MKNIWLICKKLQYFINFYSFSVTFVKFICIFENGPLVSLFWEWPIYDHPLPHFLHHDHCNNLTLWSLHQAKITAGCLVLKDLKNFVSIVSLSCFSFHFYVFIFNNFLKMKLLFFWHAVMIRLSAQHFLSAPLE